MKNLKIWEFGNGLTRDKMREEKNIYVKLVIISLMMICNSALAQSAFHGGNGDGYSSAEVKNVVLNINPQRLPIQYVQIYPNPVSSSENLQIVQQTAKPFQFEIIDLLGYCVLSRFISSTNEVINVSNLRAGTYIVNIRNDDSMIIQKLVITNP